MLNVKFDASLVNSVYNTQIKPTAISVSDDTLKVVSNMLNNFVILFIFKVIIKMFYEQKHKAYRSWFLFLYRTDLRLLNCFYL